MKILSVNSLNQQNYIKNYGQKTQNKKEKHGISISHGFNYPKGFVPYFGERLNRTPENFYEQEFNKKGMPYTLKKHLESNYEVNKLKRPMDLNKEAFADLELCESIEDVKEMFPDEPLFANLKTLETIRPKQGYLRDLRMVETKNNEVLSSGEDLTVYLLKKVFLEGKDIEEINQDFEKDMKPELKVENATKEGAYFLHSTLRSLGVHLPDKSYWTSLQATRLDKEYIPTTRTLTKPRKKPVFTKPRVSKPLNLSPEERQRRSEMMINRWIEMSPAQRLNQLAKMQEGQQNSIFYKYNEAIMLIATEKANFTDKMYHFFREKANGVEYPDDVNNANNKQLKTMKAFWAANPRLKRSFSYLIGATIREFDAAAKNEDETVLISLIEKADKIKRKNEARIMRRKLANPQYVRKILLEETISQTDFFPDSYTQKYVKFLNNNKKFNDELIPAYAQYNISNNDAQKKELFNKVQKCLFDLHNNFTDLNKKDTIAANISVAIIVRTFMEGLTDKLMEKGCIEGAANILAESVHLLTGNSQNLVEIINKYNLSELIKKNKSYVNSTMTVLSKNINEKELKKYTNNTIFSMQKIVDNMNEKSYEISDNISIVTKNSGYKILTNKTIRERAQKYLPKVVKIMNNNAKARKILSEFLKDYTGLLIYTNDLILNALAPDSKLDISKIKFYNDIKNYVYESIIDDFLVEYCKNNCVLL